MNNEKMKQYDYTFRSVSTPEGDVEVYAPPKWSDRAVSITAQQYLCEQDGMSIENMFRRVIGMLASWTMTRHGEDVYSELYDMAYHQVAAWNSPVWYNVGRYEESQTSACFINSVDDDIDSIAQLQALEMRIFKHGSGSGCNYSRLRAAGAPLSKGGVSSGPLSFMRALDHSASAIKSGGRTRRAARMAILDYEHADIYDFIRAKADEEQLAQRLHDAGMSPEEAYGCCGYQNTNHSIMIDSGDFLRDENLQRAVAEAAHMCGDPGVMFRNKINCHLGLEIRSSNPCGEFLFVDNSACNLASINLAKVKDGDHLRIVTEILAMSMDAMIDYSSYPTDEIRKNSVRYRPIGIGVTNVARAMALRDMQYGDINSLEYLSETMEVILDTAKKTIGDRPHVTCIAPTGTISLMMDCDTTGIEPYLPRGYWVKHCIDGSTIDMSPSIVKEMCAEDIEELGIGEPVSPHDQLRVIEAAQKFCDGGISKTINMPADCTVEDVRDVFVEAAKMGVKSVTIFRDGCKLWQPLGGVRNRRGDDQDDVRASTRRRLPSVRESRTHKFDIAGHEGYLTVGLYDDGTPGEIFARMSKAGSTLHGLLDWGCIGWSIALQYGCPLDKMIDKCRGMKFAPAGICRHGEIKMATSIADYIAQLLEQASGSEQKNNESQQTYTGEVCPACGGVLMRSGTCHVCVDCGQTTGCS